MELVDTYDFNAEYSIWKGVKTREEFLEVLNKFNVHELLDLKIPSVFEDFICDAYEVLRKKLGIENYDEIRWLLDREYNKTEDNLQYKIDSLKEDLISIREELEELDDKMDSLFDSLNIKFDRLIEAIGDMEIVTNIKKFLGYVGDA